MLRQRLHRPCPSHHAHRVSICYSCRSLQHVWSLLHRQSNHRHHRLHLSSCCWHARHHAGCCKRGLRRQKSEEAGTGWNGSEHDDTDSRGELPTGCQLLSLAADSELPARDGRLRPEYRTSNDEPPPVSRCEGRFCDPIAWRARDPRNTTAPVMNAIGRSSVMSSAAQETRRKTTGSDTERDEVEEGRRDGRTDDTEARTTTASDETATGGRRGGRRETQLLCT